MLLRSIRRTPSQLNSLQQIPTQHDMLPIGICHTGFADCLRASNQQNLYDIYLLRCVCSARFLMMDREAVETCRVVIQK